MTVRFTYRDKRVRIFGAGYWRKGKGIYDMDNVRYTDDAGEMHSIGPRVPDTLPPPDQLVVPDDGVKVTLTLSRQSVEFFKQVAREKHVPYQRMIRSLIDEYARIHR